MPRVFYDKEQNIEIYDVSGAKTVEDLDPKYINNNFTTIDISSDEEHAIDERGNLKKVNKTEAFEEIKNREVSRRNSAISAIKTKLDLSDEDLNNLRLALR